MNAIEEFIVWVLAIGIIALTIHLIKMAIGI